MSLPCMLEQLKSWLRKDKKQLHRPRPRIIPRLEWLEERLMLAGDTYLWSPAGVNSLASNPANWIKNGVQQKANGTIPGQNGNSPGDTVKLAQNPFGVSSNITWDQNFTFSELDVIQQYKGIETIGAGVRLDLTGTANGTALSADGFGSGALIVKFADTNGVFQIDNNASIGALSFNPTQLGGAQGTLVIDGGTTTICTGVFWKQNSVFAGTLEVSNVNEGYTTTTLEDKGQTPLVLNGKNTTIQIAPYALMQVDGGAGKTLISEANAGDNDYIDVNGGELKYLGSAGVTDTFTVPVLVGSGGNFSLDGGGGGTLAINGQEQGTNNVSLSCAGGLNLANGITLTTSGGINATSISIVATLDNSTCTIAVASGSPCIIDGTVQIDAPGFSNNTYGELVVNCTTLDFDGTLIVHLSGVNPGIGDELVVNGTLDLESDSSLTAEVDGSGDWGQDTTWTFITSSGGGIQQFANININGISGAMVMANYPSDGDDSLVFDYMPPGM